MAMLDDDTRVKYFSTIITTFIVLALVGTAGYIMFKPNDGDLSIITGIAARFEQEEKESIVAGTNKCFDTYEVQTSALDDLCLVVYDSKVYNVKNRLVRQGTFSISIEDCGKEFTVEDLQGYPDIVEQLRKYQVGRICE